MTGDHLGAANVIWHGDNNSNSLTINRFSRQLSGASVVKNTDIGLVAIWPIIDHAVTDPSGDVADGNGIPQGTCPGIDLLGMSEQASNGVLTMTLNNALTVTEAIGCSAESGDRVRPMPRLASSRVSYLFSQLSILELPEPEDGQLERTLPPEGERSQERGAAGRGSSSRDEDGRRAGGSAVAGGRLCPGRPAQDAGDGTEPGPGRSSVRLLRVASVSWALPGTVCGCAHCRGPVRRRVAVPARARAADRGGRDRQRRRGGRSSSRSAGTQRCGDVPHKLSRVPESWLAGDRIHPPAIPCGYPQLDPPTRKKRLEGSLASDGGNVAEEYVIPAQSGKAFPIPAGMVVKIVDREGSQIADVWALVSDNSSEWLSTGHTRAVLRRLFPRPGESFYTNKRRPVLTIIEDTSPGIHDALYPPCDPTTYSEVGIDDHPSCSSNFEAAVGSLGIGVAVVPDSVNLFQNSPPDNDGALPVFDAMSRPGDYVLLRAELDIVLVVTACSFDVSLPGYPATGNGKECTSIEVHLSRPAG